MNISSEEKKVIKCDLCDGKPQCVRFCEVKAVDYVDVARESLYRKGAAALQIPEAKKLGVTLQYEG